MWKIWRITSSLCESQLAYLYKIGYIFFTARLCERQMANIHVCKSLKYAEISIIIIILQSKEFSLWFTEIISRFTDIILRTKGYHFVSKKTIHLSFKPLTIRFSYNRDAELHCERVYYMKLMTRLVYLDFILKRDKNTIKRIKYTWNAKKIILNAKKSTKSQYLKIFRSTSCK